MNLFLEDYRSIGAYQRSNNPNLRQQVKRSRPNQHGCIVIISGKTEPAESLQMELIAAGYQASVVHDSWRGLAAINRLAADLVIVGWQPPGLSSVEICAHVRARQIEKPVVLLTEENQLQERIAGLEAGASDCVTLPIVKAEFLAMVAARIGQLNPNNGKCSMLCCGNLQLNRQTREVFLGNQDVRLTAREFDLLEYLMEHYFQVLTRTQILENVWGYHYSGSSNIIEVYIRYLRKKLEVPPHSNRLIHTVRSVGYILRDDL